MDDLGRWIADTFRRVGGELHVGPIRHGVALCREDLDRLIEALEEVRWRLPDRAERQAGLTTCEACGGVGTVPLGPDVHRECAACATTGLVPRPGAGA